MARSHACAVITLRALPILAGVLLLLVGPALLHAAEPIQADDTPAKKAGATAATNADAGTRSATGRRYAATNWLGAGQLLFDKMALYNKTGVMVVGRHTQVYQLNLTSGSTWSHRHAGRWQGLVDIDIHWNLAKAVGWKGAAVHATVEGRWSNGLNATSVGAFSNVSAFGSYIDAGNEVACISQFFYDQQLLDGDLLVRLGKFSLGNFDRNFFAEDASRQFMNASLVSNPTIPMPQAGLGVMAHWRPAPFWYVMGAVVDADADHREMGFNTAFHGADNSFTIVEAGYEPLFFGKQVLPGAYRVGFWYDPQAKPRFHNGQMTPNAKRDDCGFYLNFAQMLWKENDEPLDLQGLGIFGRYGYRHGGITWTRGYWSLGCQYQGLIPGRRADVIGLGVAQLFLEESTGLQKPNETAYELYYDAPITPWFNVGASIQYVKYPGGLRALPEAVVVSFRASLTF